jgi:hypothetical protein
MDQLQVGTSHGWDMSDFTLLIVDEVQDMRPNLSRFLRILLNNVCKDTKPLRILLLGDPRQLLYHFYRQNRADARFLTHGEQLYRSINERTWVNCNLTRSFRSTFSIATVLNSLLKDHDMVPRDESICAPVELYIGDIRSDTSPNIVRILGTDRESSVLVLCPSTNSASPARTVVSTMISAGIVVNVIRSGNLSDPPMVCSEQETKKQISVQTFCSSKGLESPVVIVLCDRTSLFDSMENATYVAITRATRRLIIIVDGRYTSRESLSTLAYEVRRRAGDRLCLNITMFPSANAKIHQTITQMQTWVVDQRTYHSIEKHKLSVLMGLLSAVQMNASREHIMSRVVYSGEVEHIFESPDEDTYRCFYHCCDGSVLPTSDTLCFPTLINIDGVYARSFESSGKNLLQLIGQISYQLLYLHFTGGVDPVLLSFVDENPSQSKEIVQLVHMGELELFNCGPYSGNMYDLVRFIPALTFLSVAHDAHVGYEDKLSAICSYSFAQQADVLRRILGIIHTLEVLLERKSSITLDFGMVWKLATDCRVIRLQDDRLFFRHGCTGVCILHTASIDIKDHIAAGVRLILYGLDKMYIANTMDGSVITVTTTIENGITYVSDLCSAILRIDDDLEDDDFVVQYRV